MFPVNEEIKSNELNEETIKGNKSFIFDFNMGDFKVSDGKVETCEEIDALKVWIEKILHTEKDRFEIYINTKYGCRLEDLIIGNNYPIAFIESELKREVEEALLKNSKIKSINNFKLERSASSLTIGLGVDVVDKGTNTFTVTF